MLVARWPRAHTIMHDIYCTLLQEHYKNTKRTLIYLYILLILPLFSIFPKLILHNYCV